MIRMLHRPPLRALLVGAAVVPLVAGCDVITRGHVDAIAVRKVGTVLQVDARNGTVHPPRHQPTDSLTYVADRDAIGTVPPNPAYGFLGPPGSRVWILPQVENPDLPWLGWNTEGVPRGFVQHNRVRLRLLGVEGPGPAAVYTVNALGSPTVIFNSADGLPDARTVNVGVHQHVNWAFREPGAHTLRMEVTATYSSGQPFTEVVRLRFETTEDDR